MVKTESRSWAYDHEFPSNCLYWQWDCLWLWMRLYIHLWKCNPICSSERVGGEYFWGAIFKNLLAGSLFLYQHLGNFLLLYTTLKHMDILCFCYLSAMVQRKQFFPFRKDVTTTTDKTREREKMRSPNLEGSFWRNYEYIFAAEDTIWGKIGIYQPQNH